MEQQRLPVTTSRDWRFRLESAAHTIYSGSQKVEWKVFVQVVLSD